MRLLTHNFLKSTVKGTTKGYPLKILAQEIQILESSVDETLLKSMLQKINYETLQSAYSDIQKDLPGPIDIPEKLPETLDNSTTKNLYTLLFDVHIMAGKLVCPDSNREFPIKDGIPNMILHEDEI